MNAEVLIIRSNDVPSLYDVVLADFQGENSKYLVQHLDFDEAVDIRKEYGMLYGLFDEPETVDTTEKEEA